MIIANIVMDFLHLMAIVVWIGGLFYQSFVLMPVLKKAEPAVSAKIMGGTVKKFRILVLSCIIVTIFSGVFLTIGKQSIVGFAMFSFYGTVLLIKHILTAIMVIIWLIASYYFFPAMQKLATKGGSQGKMAQFKRSLVSIGLTNTILGILVLMLTAMLPFI